MHTKLVSVSLLTGVLMAAAATARESHERGRDHDISKVNASIELESDEHADELSSVNGAIRVGDRAIFSSAQTVNGSVRIGEDCRADSLRTVNGRITIGSRSTISGTISTVNGRLELADGAVVRGDARNVNNNITLGEHAVVGGRVTTRSGNITLSDGARVEGGIHVKDDGRWSNFFSNIFSGISRSPVIDIGPGAEVRGDLVFDREVELRVHTTAKIGAVKGASVERY